jgi:hypothetical protein
MNLTANAPEYTWEDAVEDTAANFRQKFRALLLAKSGEVGVG